MVGQIFNVGTIRLKYSGFAHTFVFLAIPFGESPFLGDIDLEKYIVVNSVEDSICNFFTYIEYLSDNNTFTHVYHLRTFNGNMKEQLTHHLNDFQIL